MRVIKVTKAFNSATMTGTTQIQTEEIDISQMAHVSAQVTWTSTATGSLKLQGSNDKVAWEDIATYSVVSAGSKLLKDSNAGYNYARLAYVNATNTGTMGDAYFMAKGGSAQ